MPLYEYQCKSCENRFEKRQKFSDPAETVCPSCGGEVEKLISQSGFALKGGGWYGDGYSSSNGKPTPPCQGGGGGCAGCPSAA
ncbi:FmdB family zinc ribbon protein [Geomesophilobacter sediminis]|uniref:Zinc ribbon domain-containing protein n=1 Tax=Geomesophilobacter sediminis TaxID=2798584 RepID=A0A8J7M0G7_9BACT|nr:zinc ribbon domain-containing protein [Geomesophilobacter sediminis]MBJ6725097.1 zinc ribbon domain-containing protein [Geomesophilobacter sediminis]